MFKAAKALPQEKTFIQQFWLFKRLLISKITNWIMYDWLYI